MSYLKTSYRGATGFGNVRVDEVGTAHLSALAEKFNKPTRIPVLTAARKIVSD